MLALVEPYSSVMVVSILVFSAAIAGLYFWTKARASVAPAVDNAALPEPEASFR